MPECQNKKSNDFKLNSEFTPQFTWKKYTKFFKPGCPS